MTNKRSNTFYYINKKQKIANVANIKFINEFDHIVDDDFEHFLQC